eukprot:CAMPEP_0175447798 /NCGR_PEP_ID=MMETSP0095-20121207/60995_1 /TAXON_ID=311494 /ORGANISM="Alexandrium monilatum, Strain CCMP3105" /LENGTH=46 /DNA_ID= /DNA_START= /DNA_END= /DNA_ORIENTATION=
MSAGRCPYEGEEDDGDEGRGKGTSEGCRAWQSAAGTSNTHAPARGA